MQIRVEPAKIWCDRLFQTDENFWYYCRLDPGHDGDCTCPAALKGK